MVSAALGGYSALAERTFNDPNLPNGHVLGAKQVVSLGALSMSVVIAVMLAGFHFDLPRAAALVIVAFQCVGFVGVLVWATACLEQAGERQRRADQALAEARSQRIGLFSHACHESARRQRLERLLRSTEEQLRHAQKMEAVARLSGGVAHDFNNVLSVISGYSKLLLDELDPSTSAYSDVEQIAIAGERAAGLTRQLLAFCRKERLAPEKLDVNEVVHGASKMLSRLLGENVALSFSLDATGRAYLDRSQLEQVLFNLVVNARDAMPEGGRLAVHSFDWENDGASSSRDLDLAPGKYVVLAVTDTGMGMSAATRAHIFEPFFTTKEQGKGTGLGLSTVFGIVQQCGGGIRVQSELGRGATFQIYLPRTDEGSLESRPAAPRCSRMAGAERVLLVEDDDQVRTVTAAILRRNGYDVLETSNSDDALRICEQFRGELDLLLTDVMLPRLNGVDLCEYVRRLRPGIATLFMSGHCEEEIGRRATVTKGAGFVRKPVTPQLLLENVRAVLSANVGAPQELRGRDVECKSFADCAETAPI